MTYQLEVAQLNNVEQVQATLITSAKAVQSAQADATHAAMSLIGHAMFTDSLECINSTCAKLLDAGEKVAADSFRSYAARAFTGIVNDRENNTLRISKAMTGSPLELDAKYKADPAALIIRENKARGEKQPKRLLKANDVKTLCARFRNGVEGNYTDEQIAQIKEHLGQLCVTMGLVV